MAHDFDVSTNKGFNEVACENALERINGDYAKLMVQVPQIQSTAMESLCRNWISKKGKETITRIRVNFNKLLVGITQELNTIFIYTNEQAAVIAQDSDGIAYHPVKFKSSDEEFNSNNAKDDVENGKVVQWDEEATSNALKQLGNFIAEVSRTMKNIEGDVESIEKAFGGYSEAGYEIAARFKKLGANVTTMTIAINDFLEPLEESYGSEAAAHKSNVQELSSKAFQETDTADFTFE